jgi:hypothetical protein
MIMHILVDSWVIGGTFLVGFLFGFHSAIAIVSLKNE